MISAKLLSITEGPFLSISNVNDLYNFLNRLENL